MATSKHERIERKQREREGEREGHDCRMRAVKVNTEGGEQIGDRKNVEPIWSRELDLHVGH